MTKSHVLTHISMYINDIHFKYNLAGERDRILTSVAHLRKKAELKVVGVLAMRTWSVAGVSVLVCTRRAAFETSSPAKVSSYLPFDKIAIRNPCYDKMRLRWIGGSLGVFAYTKVRVSLVEAYI